MQEITAEVIEKKQLTHDTIFLSLEVPEDFSFKAGQFVMFKINNGTEERLRAYSILSPESQKGKLDFVIRIIEGGFAGEVFRKTEVGDEFVIRGPMGHMIFAEDSPNKENWFVCCGCGIASLHSMIKTYLKKFPEKKFILLFGTKRREDLLFYDELKELEEKNPNFTYIPALTREEWEGKMGRVQKNLPEDVKNKTFYICGLKELVMDTKDLLLEKGVKNEDVKFERYN